jgi:hypothetical protein
MLCIWERYSKKVIMFSVSQQGIFLSMSRRCKVPTVVAVMNVYFWFKFASVMEEHVHQKSPNLQKKNGIARTVLKYGPLLGVRKFVSQ